MDIRALKETLTHRAARLGRRWGHWLLFLAFAFLGWRTSLLKWGCVIPTYGDVLELAWLAEWFHDTSAGRHSWLFDPSTYFPQGLQLTTLSNWGPAAILLVSIFSLIDGAGFAYNWAAMLTSVLCFAGARRLALGFVSPWAAAVAATVYTFTPLRWYSINAGHLNNALATAALPWMAWCLERSVAAPQRGWRWLAGAGGFWALSVWGSLYFTWLGGLLLLAWLAARLLGGGLNWTQAGRALGIACVVAGALSALATLPGWLGRQAAEVLPFQIGTIVVYGASANSLPIPALQHPLLGGLARLIYRGQQGAQSWANLGLLTSVAALAGLFMNRRGRGQVYFLTFLIFIGVLMALGVFLKWDDQVVQWDATRPLTAFLWRIGYELKPAFFIREAPRNVYQAAVPLPGLLAVICIPLIDQGRVFARYIVLALLGTTLAATMVITKTRRRWAQLIWGGLLLAEVIPWPARQLPFPPPMHAAFEWLQRYGAADGAVLDIRALDEARLAVDSGGGVLWAARLHGYPIVSAFSSTWPAQAAFLKNWLPDQKQPLRNPALAPTLRFYGVRYLLVHRRGRAEETLLRDLPANPDLRVVGEFEPPAGPSPWAYPIIIVEILPPAGR